MKKQHTMPKAGALSRLIAVALALTLILAFAASCKKSDDTGGGSGTDGGASTEPIKLGTSFPMTGSVAADGLYIVQSIQFAVDEVNAAGGINGRLVTLVSEDDKSNPADAATIANKFAENKD
ncbi:MAG: ABC transporter substrate-binding protein, partial [Oscillospiraceae bacterium]|nr:ABC transporter substrate-binding protein [Oscillospiraceae bacterium]